MMIEDVLIESYDMSNRVCIIPYDRENELILGDSIEVMRRDEAFDSYNVIGEIFNGEITLFDGDNGEADFDYSDFFPEDDEEE